MGYSPYDQVASHLAARCKSIKDQVFNPDMPMALVIFDTETTGLSSVKDWPYELAALFVSIQDGVYNVVHSFHSYLDWVGSGVVPFEEFNERLSKTNEAMAAKDPMLRRPDAHEIQALGKHPFNVLRDFSVAMQFFYNAHPNHRHSIGGHNVFMFDASCMHQAYSKVGLHSPLLHSVVDTGLILKAAQHDGSLDPGNFATPTDWILKTSQARLKIKWSLSGFCDPMFHLRERLPDFVASFRHTALTDVWMVLTLLHTFDHLGKVKS
jgi:hypothetical protein